MYEIKVLGSDEFDEISKSDRRYSYVDDTNLGFADRLKGIAYVRDSNIHDLNKYLINHELEELIEEQSHHEDPNGIRHKKGPKFFKDIIGGLFGRSEAPQREAAQTTYVEGLGSVPNSQLPFIQSSGSYSPGNLGVQFGAGGPAGSPLSLFSPSSGSYTPANVPSAVGGSFSSGLGTGLGAGISPNGSLTPEQIERLKGNFSGRIEF